MTSVKEALRTAIMVLMLVAGSAILGHFIAITEHTSEHRGLGRGPTLESPLDFVLICIIYLVGGRSSMTSPS